MRKYESILLFILAIALMLLASCRTTKAVETERHEAVVHTLDYQDSLHHELNLAFDKLDVWFLDTAQTVRSDSTLHTSPRHSLLKHISITNGVLTNNDNKVRKRCEVDSISSKAQEVIHPVRVPPKLNLYLVLVVIFFIILKYIIGSKIR